MKPSPSDTPGLFSSYPSWRVPEFSSRRFAPELFHEVVDRIVTKQRGAVDVEDAGLSFEGRPIRVYHAGRGPTKILLWSQMHGDESTATMAIADTLNYFQSNASEEPARTILSSLHLLFAPMLNPDGAARFQRRTAQGIDINRDALELVTPEARVLKKLRDDHTPAFGFNLHDQELSTVGDSREFTAMAILAPAFDEKRSDNETRRKAKRVAASFLETITQLASGRIARYDDAFEPRAFGDTMQRRGTSTVLIESGHVRDDPEKQYIRRLNAIGMINSLRAVATGEYADSDLTAYESLPVNGKKAYDVIIRGVRIQHVNGSKTKADLGVSYQVETHSGDIPLLVDAGDLNTFVGLKEIDGKQKIVRVEDLRFGENFFWEAVLAG